MNRPPSQTASSTPISGKKTVQGKSASSSTTAKSRARKKAMDQLNEEQVALHAYFIADRRRKLGMPGDQTSDWYRPSENCFGNKTKATSIIHEELANFLTHITLSISSSLNPS